jgi:hypothetical protein
MDIREKSYWPQKLAVAALWNPVFGLRECKANGRTHGYPLSEPVKRGMPVVITGPMPWYSLEFQQVA